MIGGDVEGAADVTVGALEGAFDRGATVGSDVGRLVGLDRDGVRVGPQKLHVKAQYSSM